MYCRTNYLTVAFLSAFLLAPQSTSVAVPARPLYEPTYNGRTVTYRYTARIISNDGITPFKVGAVIAGSFTYDLDSKSRDATPPRNTQDSPRNAITLEIDGGRFAGSGKVILTVGHLENAEHIGIVTDDIRLPDGWEGNRAEESQGLGLMFQNVPPRGVIPPIGNPDSIALDSFVNTREVRLVFVHGVRFPGGKAKGHVAVRANIVTLDKVAR